MSERDERRRATSEFRDRGRDEREGYVEGYVEVALPHLDDDTSQSTAVRREQAEALAVDGVVYVVDGRYFCDDARELNEALVKLTALLVCDFCSASGPAWDYDAGFAVIEADIEADGTTVHASRGGWFACADCAALIEADDVEGIRERAVVALARVAPGQPIEVVREAIELTQSAFWRARTGTRRALQ